MRLFALVALLIFAGCARSELLPAGEFTSIVPDVVRTIEYETPDFRFSAHRFNLVDNFQIVVQQPSASTRSCNASPEAMRVIRDLEALRIKGQIAETQLDEGPFHRLRYAAEPPMQAYEELLTLLPSGHLALMSDGHAYELTLTKQSVDALARACR